MSFNKFDNNYDHSKVEILQVETQEQDGITKYKTICSNLEWHSKSKPFIISVFDIRTHSVLESPLYLQVVK